MFPYGWEDGLLKGQVEPLGFVHYAMRVKMLELMYGEAISAWGSWVLVVRYSIAHPCWSEVCSLEFQPVVFVNASKQCNGGPVWSVLGWSGEHPGKFYRNFPAICENSTLERDWLIGVLMPTISRQNPEYFEVIAGAAFYWARFITADCPPVLFRFPGYLGFKIGNLFVCGICLSDFIPLTRKILSMFAQAYGVISDFSARNVTPRGI